MKLLHVAIFGIVCRFLEGCRKNSDCSTGFCDGGRIWPFPSGRCVPKVADGQRCLENGDKNSCISNQCTCGICGQKVAAGSKCSKNENCRSGWCEGRITVFCSGRCREKAQDGQSCSSHFIPGIQDANSCKSGKCTCGTCGKKVAENKACSKNEHCKSGWCSPIITVLCRGKCKGKRNDYESCTLNVIGSGDNNVCKSGRCEKTSISSAQCAPKNGFRVGSKCNKDTDCDKTKSLWCKGGSFYSSGKWTECPLQCSNGCSALFNQEPRCGRKTTFEQAADLTKKISDEVNKFVHCLEPESNNCLSDVQKGVSGCLNPKQLCKIKIGGKGSKCLTISNAAHAYQHESGPLSLSGSVEPTGGLSIEAEITNGKVTIGFYGKVAISAKVKIEAKGPVKIPMVTKKLYLTHCDSHGCSRCRNPGNKTHCWPKTIFTKLLLFGYIPVIIEVKVQAVAITSLYITTKGAFKGEISYQNDAAIKIKRAIASFDPLDGVKFDLAYEKDFNKDITKTVVVNAAIGLLAVIRIGAEISVSVNGIPIHMLLATRFVMEGNLGLSIQSPHCVTGSLAGGIGLDAGISIDFKVPNAGKLMGTSCRGIVNGVCKTHVAKAASCAAKLIAKIDPCKKANEICGDMEREVAKLTPSNLGKTYTDTAIIVKASFAQFQLRRGLGYCLNGRKTFISAAGDIGAGKLKGGGGGTGPRCGTPGNMHCIKGDGEKTALSSQMIMLMSLFVWWLACSRN